MINFLLDCNSESVKTIMHLVREIIKWIQIGIPIILVIFGMLDLGKAVMAGKEDEMKKFQGALIKRVIYAVVVFLVITIVQIVMSLVADVKTDVDEQTWIQCLYGDQYKGSGGVGAES